MPTPSQCFPLFPPNQDHNPQYIPIHESLLLTPPLSIPTQQNIQTPPLPPLPIRSLIPTISPPRPLLPRLLNNPLPPNNPKSHHKQIHNLLFIDTPFHNPRTHNHHRRRRLHPRPPRF